jgi:DNA-binding transcriptional regulator YhcF (GntR family)
LWVSSRTAIGQIDSVPESAIDPPLRQLTRLRAEMAIASSQLTARLLPDEPMLGVKLGIVARICLSDWISGGSLVRPSAPARAITMRKMALSLGSAPETTRRHVKLLLDRGVFASSTHGVSLAATAANETLVSDYYLGVHDLFLRLIEDMSATCDIALPVGETRGFGIGDVIERALDVLMLPIDTYRPAKNSLLAFLLWGALTVVAVRDVTHDPILSRQYANAIPPDDLRIGISLRELATILSIPYATTWRQVQLLQTAGLVTRLSGNRWTVLTANLLRENVREISAPPSALMLRKIRELALLGLDPARAADHYQQGRPPLAELRSSENR